MKKLLVAGLSLFLLVGCNSPKTSTKKEHILKVGIGSVSKLKAQDAKKGSGMAKFGTTIATVILEDDVIKYLYFDKIEDQSNFDANGKFTANNTKVRTNKEKGEDYGMKKVSKIGKEWNEQVGALEKWAIGKKVADFKAMKTVKDDKGAIKITEKELTTGVTIKVNQFLASFDKAVENAVEVSGTTKVAKGMTTKMVNKDAKSTQYNVTYALLALDKNDKVISAITDVAQNTVYIDAKGMLTKEVKAVPTKGEMKDSYGMKKASKIGKEWYEQNAAFDKWLVGKSKEDIENMKVEQKDANHVVSADKDLLTGATMSIGELQKTVLNSFMDVIELN